MRNRPPRPNPTEPSTASRAGGPRATSLASGTETIAARAPSEEPGTLRRYWETAKRSDFMRKVAETYVTQIALIGMSLVTTVAVTRALGPEGRGLYSVAMAVGAIGVLIGNVGLQASNTYYLSQDRALLPSILGNSMLISVGVGGLGGAVIWEIFSLRPHLAPVHGVLLVLGLAWVPAGICYTLLGRILLALNEVRSYNKLELLHRCCALALIGVVIVSHRVGPHEILAANLLALVATSGWALAKLRPFLSRFPWPSFVLLYQHSAVGFRSYIITVLSFLVVRIDLLMVKYLLNSEQTGYYSVASTMADYILMLPAVSALILFPRLAAITDIAEKVRQTRSAVIGTAVALATLLTVASVVARVAVLFLFGKAFLPAADAFIWLTPGIFTLGVEIVAVQFMNSLGYPKVLIWIWSVSVLLNVTLNLWAIPRFGIKGAAAVSSISYTLTLLAILFAIWRRCYRTHRESMPPTSTTEINVARNQICS